MVPILILNWNGWENCQVCIDSISATISNPCIWLIDNGSENDLSGKFRQLFPGLRIMRWNDNYGWAGGYNRAISVAIQEGFEYVYLLNNDCVVTPDFLSQALRVMLNDTALASVGSCIVDATTPTYLRFDGQYHSSKSKRINEAPQIEYVASTNGAGMLIRLQAFQETGEFDERYFCYGEEEDWCHRAIKKGWSHAVTGASMIIHQGEGSDINNNARYYRTRNQFLTWQKEYINISQLEKIKFIYSVLRAANEARRLKQHDVMVALLEALRDGCNSHFERRKNTPLPKMWYLLAYTWWFPTGFFRNRVPLLKDDLNSR